MPKLWIISNQLARRNLTPEQTKYLRGMRYELEKQEAHRPEKKGDHLNGKTAEKLAKEYGVSAPTIRRS